MATTATRSNSKSTHTGPNVGHVTQVIGSTFDVEFAEASLPAIYNAVKIYSEHKGIKVSLTGEVQQHLGGGRVRCVALGSTDGMVRGQECVDTGSPVTVPVGPATLGRVFNLIGEPVDGRGPVNATERWSIHRDAPPLIDLSTKTVLPKPAPPNKPALPPRTKGVNRSMTLMPVSKISVLVESSLTSGAAR